MQFRTALGEWFKIVSMPKEYTLEFKSQDVRQLNEIKKDWLVITTTIHGQQSQFLFGCRK